MFIVNNKVIISGSAGFIGFHLAKKLIDMGFDVIGVDSLNDAYDVRLKNLRLSNNDKLEDFTSNLKSIFEDYWKSKNEINTSVKLTLTMSVNNNNYLTFSTRRNRKTSLTEYYDLVYEYKNDCLTAGISYHKSYYSDNDLRPEEDVLLTISLFPLTVFEQDVKQEFYRKGDSSWDDGIKRAFK